MLLQSPDTYVYDIHSAMAPTSSKTVDAMLANNSLGTSTS